MDIIISGSLSPKPQACFTNQCRNHAQMMVCPFVTIISHFSSSLLASELEDLGQFVPLWCWFSIFGGGASEIVRIRVSVYEVYHGLPILPWRTAGNRLSLRLQQAERSLGMPCELAAEAQIKPTEPCWCFIAFCDELQRWVKCSSFHLLVLKFFYLL